MAIEGIDPYFAIPPAATPPPEEKPAPAQEQEVITEENTGNTIDTTA
ncbi:MAG: hypothetical protein JXD23_04480 [Spirochaetales bacterium]|nr:hypothetical protein [Spirochaetales bacterium]